MPPVSAADALTSASMPKNQYCRPWAVGGERVDRRRGSRHGQSTPRTAGSSSMSTRHVLHHAVPRGPESGAGFTRNDSAAPEPRRKRRFAGTSHAGGGTRTPETRIMIPRLWLRQTAGACALGTQRVEREVERRDVFRRGPDVERRSLGSVTQRVVVGDADPHGGLPRAGCVESIAQRLGFEMPDPPAARGVHRVVISAPPVAVQAMSQRTRRAQVRLSEPAPARRAAGTLAGRVSGGWSGSAPKPGGGPVREAAFAGHRPYGGDDEPPAARRAYSGASLAQDCANFLVVPAPQSFAGVGV